MQIGSRDLGIEQETGAAAFKEGVSGGVVVNTVEKP
jgi:hypothetical protein